MYTPWYFFVRVYIIHQNGDTLHHTVLDIWKGERLKGDVEDLEQSGQQISLSGLDWSTTKQSDRHNTTKNVRPLHPTLGKRTEHDDDDDDDD